VKLALLRPHGFHTTGEGAGVAGQCYTTVPMSPQQLRTAPRMAANRIDPHSTALLLIDLQNDALHRDGAYGRAGLASDALGALPGRLLPVAQALRRRGGWIAATHFTMLAGKQGKPIMTEHTRKLRPFLKQGDFLRGSWGHALVDPFADVDLHIDKFTPSAFDMTPLDWALRQIKVDTLLLAGITTPVSVAATLRDALQRDFRVIVLEDGVAATDPKQHSAALSEMAALTLVRGCADAMALMA
jgi:ureidoacrylate peracid hydrolase